MEYIKGFLVFFAIGIAIYLFVIFVWWAVDKMDSTAPRITYKIFKDMYDLNSDAWELDGVYVYHRERDSSLWYGSTSREVVFKRFIDVVFYRIFKRFERERINKASISKNEVELYKALQKDIDEARKEAENFVKEKINGT